MSTRARATETFTEPTRWLRTPQGPIACAELGRGAPLLLLHGLAGDFTHFRFTAPLLAERYRVIGLDMPGNGASVKPLHRVSIAQYARTVLDCMDALGLERATLVGHSAGGMVAGLAALAAPQRIEKLVLVNSAGLRAYPAPLRSAVRGLLRPWLLEQTLEHLAIPMLDQVFATRNEYTRRFVEAALDRPHHPMLEQIAKVFHDLGPELLTDPVRQRAAELRMPTLMVWGDRDKLIPLPTVHAVSRELPNCRLEVFEGSGHMVMVEQPGRFASVLKSFLATHEARSAVAA